MLFWFYYYCPWIKQNEKEIYNVCVHWLLISFKTHHILFTIYEHCWYVILFYIKLLKCYYMVFHCKFFFSICKPVWWWWWIWWWYWRWWISEFCKEKVYFLGFNIKPYMLNNIFGFEIDIVLLYFILYCFFCIHFMLFLYFLLYPLK